MQEKPETKKPKPLEELLRIKWIGLIEPHDNNPDLPPGKPLVKNGIVLPGAIGLHAFDAKTGKKLYFEKPDDSKIIFDSLGDSLLFFSSRHHAKVMNIKNGELIHIYRQNAAMPFIENLTLTNNGCIPIIDKKEVLLRDIVSGDIKASYDLPSSINGNILITDDYVLVGDRKSLYFLDFDGNIIDSLTVGRLASDPFVHDNIIYVNIRNKGVFALNSQDRKVEWVYNVENTKGSFQMINDMLVLNDGDITFLDKKKGFFYKKYEVDGSLSEEQFFSYGNYLISFIEGYSNIPVICAVNSLDGSLEYVYWKDAGVFDFNGLYKREPVHPEDDVVKFLGPIFTFSEVYDNMIFGQWQNMVVGFEIIESSREE